MTGSGSPDRMIDAIGFDHRIEGEGGPAFALAPAAVTAMDEKRPARHPIADRAAGTVAIIMLSDLHHASLLLSTANGMIIAGPIASNSEQKPPSPAAATARRLVLPLLVLALVALPFTWFLPLFRTELLVFPSINEVTVIGAARTLFKADLLLFAVIVLFGMVVPVAKLAGLIYALSNPAAPKRAAPGLARSTRSAISRCSISS